ncbi:hypothetical protein RQP53_23910 [Paucibacter sp. APW11]|uniref:DUF8198 domain-containing protein n=1 Tax=Roseateles aquae TaxID=3077235 RepID=A0ABU3PIG6_9BURK|nr:hypothetical protein [Paucibacter sp. APW11]MDT9002348.1 hypothetical protein [Paucibacter sp. APW11]
MDQQILQFLQQVETERSRRAADASLQARVLALKRYQQQRFSRSYADLLASPRYGQAAGFFLNELYGPDDFSQRDAQFARVVPALVKLFPQDVVRTVRWLAELHAISEMLDGQMGAALNSETLNATLYVRAWQQVGQPALRQRQIELTLQVGEQLDAFTRKPLLRQALRMMRGPAQAAGLSALQHFLETGFDTFKAMAGAREFLATVKSREERLAAALFAAQPDCITTCPPGDELLGQLP